MIEIRGLYNTALCYTSALEEKAAEQIRTVCDQEEFGGCRIRIMPDVHAGKGCTIGTTMTISDKVVPGMVGVDIGCGMETVRLAEREIDFAALDALIRREVPSGRNVRGGEHPFNAEIDLSELRCAHSVSLDWARRSIGTLGGGNHFIEIDRAENGALYLVVHSGSRYLGTQVCAYYQEQGQLALRRGAQERVNALIAEYRAAGRQREIRSALKELDGERVKRIPKDLAYVEGKLFEDYIHDMHITQRFAALNRKAITDVILRGMGLIVLHSGHNSKIFKRLMGTSCSLKWRDGARERLWCANPGHPIAQGLPEHFELDVEEMYGEFFDIPEPLETVFIGWFNGGEVFRSGVTFRRGLGNVFYFQPGHEGNPTFHNENIQKVITNAVRWAAPTTKRPEIFCPCVEPLENV